MQLIAQNLDTQRRDFSLSFLALLIISSIVIADPNLNLPDEFNNLNVDAIFNRESQLREPKEDEENKWREDKEPKELDTNVRWGAVSIYDNTNDPDPFGTNDDQTNNVLRSPKAAPQLEIRF